MGVQIPLVAPRDASKHLNQRVNGAAQTGALAQAQVIACRCGRPLSCQDCSRLLTKSLAIRCPACLREESSLAQMVCATPAPSTLATSLGPV